MTAAARENDPRLVHLPAFVAESNRIEGIPSVREGELEASERFLRETVITVADLEAFVDVCQPGAKLRKEPGMDVRINNFHPMPGGPMVFAALDEIIVDANADQDPYEIHHRYETLHPFMDGNGRSGRILWAWQMLKQDLAPRLALGFLHAWYYQSLQFDR